MSYIICGIIFLIINFKGLKYICSKKTFESNSPFKNQEDKLIFSGPEMFVILTLSCAPIAVAPFGLSMRLLFWILIVIIGLSFNGKKNYSNLTRLFYLFFILYFLYSLFFETSTFQYGLRTFFRYLLPYLLLLFIPGNIKNYNIFPKIIHVMCKVFKWWFIYLSLSFIGFGFILNFILNGFWWWGPAILDIFGIIIPTSIIASKLFKDKRYLWLIVGCCIVPLVGYVIRTGLVAVGISLMSMAFFKYKYRSLPIILIACIIGIAAVLFIPQLNKKMYKSNVGEINTLSEATDFNNIESNTRFLVWEAVLNRFYNDKKLFGSGIGTLQQFCYENESSHIKIVHNDYIQLLCDTGLISLILYLSIIFTIFIHSYFIYNNKQLHLYCRYAAFIAGPGILSVAATMMTDNVVNYTMTTLVYPFSFYALALGLKNIREEKIIENQEVDYVI